MLIIKNLENRRVYKERKNHPWSRHFSLHGESIKVVRALPSHSRSAPAVGRFPLHEAAHPPDPQDEASTAQLTQRSLEL